MSDPSTVVLKTSELCLSYGKLRAVDQLNMVVREGEIYGFLGRNGAGKTSTIRMLMGMIRPDRGRIELLGYGGRRIGVKQKQRIGYVSQEQFFYSWMTCRGLGSFVSGFYPTWDDAEFNRLLTLLDLPPRRKVSHLSGGMRVKLALALALAHRPPILILDEPTSGLDPVARREFLEIIRRQARSHRRTTFFSSHLIDEVERVADRVGIIHNGQLRYEGDIDTLRSSVRRVRFAPASDGVERLVTGGPQQIQSAKPSLTEPQPESRTGAPARQEYTGGQDCPSDEMLAPHAHLARNDSNGLEQEEVTRLPPVEAAGATSAADDISPFRSAEPTTVSHDTDDVPVLAEAVEDANAASAFQGPLNADYPAGNIGGETTSGCETLTGTGTHPIDNVPQVATDPSLRREYIGLAEANGFKVLEGNFENESSLILLGKPDDWDKGVFPPQLVSQLSLEDIFIALAVETTPDL